MVSIAYKKVLKEREQHFEDVFLKRKSDSELHWSVENKKWVLSIHRGYAIFLLREPYFANLHPGLIWQHHD
jgi:hypothetical protein